MAKQALYALSEGEKVIFELNIDDFAKPEKTGFFAFCTIHFLLFLYILSILCYTDENKAPQEGLP